MCGFPTTLSLEQFSKNTTFFRLPLTAKRCAGDKVGFSIILIFKGIMTFDSPRDHAFC